MLLRRRLGVPVAAAMMVETLVVMTAPAFGAANERASCVGAQRSTAEQGDVGRYSRTAGGAQDDLATFGEQPGRTTQGQLLVEGSGPPGKPPDEGFSASSDCSPTTPTS